MAFPLKNHTESPRFIMGLWEMTDLNLCDLPLHASPIHSEQHSFKLKLISERDESHAKTKEFWAEFIGGGYYSAFQQGLTPVLWRCRHGSTALFGPQGSGTYGDVLRRYWDGRDVWGDMTITQVVR